MRFRFFGCTHSLGILSEGPGVRGTPLLPLPGFFQRFKYFLALLASVRFTLSSLNGWALFLLGKIYEKIGTIQRSLVGCSISWLVMVSLWLFLCHSLVFWEVSTVRFLRAGLIFGTRRDYRQLSAVSVAGSIRWRLWLYRVGSCFGCVGFPHFSLGVIFRRDCSHGWFRLVLVVLAG